MTITKSLRLMKHFHPIDITRLAIRTDLPEDFVRLHAKNAVLIRKVNKLQQTLFWVCVAGGLVLVLIVINNHQKEEQDEESNY